LCHQAVRRRPGTAPPCASTFVAVPICPRPSYSMTTQALEKLRNAPADGRSSRTTTYRRRPGTRVTRRPRESSRRLDVFKSLLVTRQLSRHAHGLRLPLAAGRRARPIAGLPSGVALDAPRRATRRDASKRRSRCKRRGRNRAAAHLSGESIARSLRFASPRARARARAAPALPPSGARAPAGRFRAVRTCRGSARG